MSSIQKRIADAATEIVNIDPWSAGAVGYIPRIFARGQPWPHNKQNADAYRCVDGDMTVSVVDTTSVGLPSGTRPRIITVWLTTKVVQEKKRKIRIDDSLKGFMREMGIMKSGAGDTGSNTYFKREAAKLFGCSIGFKNETDEKLSTESLSFSSRQEISWESESLGMLSNEGSFVELSVEFYENIRLKPVPIDLRAFRALQNSSLGLDLYTWLTYRMYSLKKETAVPLIDLHNQLGANYDITKRGLGNFQSNLKIQLGKTRMVYPEVNTELVPGRLMLYPSPTSVPLKKQDKT